MVYKVRIYLNCILLVVLLPGVSIGMAATLQGYVKKVIDGDSLLIKTSEGKVREVRLYGIDSPEYDQPYADLSKKYLKKKILKKSVYIKIMDRDRYSRDICLVQKDKTVINSELVRLGYAWVYPRYCKKEYCKTWKKYQQVAQRNKKGLWKSKKNISPWVWKHK